MRDIIQYTEDYMNHDFEDIMVHYRRKKVLEILNTYKPKNILEIGCGVQSIFDFYDGYRQFTVIDPSKFFCDKIKQSDKYTSNVSVINDFLENQVEELSQNNYDFIILSSLLHEVVDPIQLLSCVRAICDRQTIIHINVPNSESFHLLWAYKAGMIQRIGDLTDSAKRFQQNTTFNMQGLTQMLVKLNYIIIDKGSYFIKPFNHTKMQCLLNNGIIDKRLLDGLYDLTEYFPDNAAEIYVNCKIS